VKDKERRKQVWNKIFYKEPEDWEELRKACEKFCKRPFPNVYRKECETCKILRDCLKNMGASIFPRPTKYPESF